MHAVAYAVMEVGGLSPGGFVVAVFTNAAKCMSKDSGSVYESLHEAVIYFLCCYT